MSTPKGPKRLRPTVSAEKSNAPQTSDITISSPRILDTHDATVSSSSGATSLPNSDPVEAIVSPVDFKPFRLLVTKTINIQSQIYDPITSTWQVNTAGVNITNTTVSHEDTYKYKDNIAADCRDGLKGKEGVTYQQYQSGSLDAFAAFAFMEYGCKGGYPGDDARHSTYQGRINFSRLGNPRGLKGPPFPAHSVKCLDTQLVPDSSGGTRLATATEEDFKALLDLWTAG